MKPTKSKRSESLDRRAATGRDARHPATGEVLDRRLGLDRREGFLPDDTKLERRRGPGRRLSDFLKSAEEGEMTQEQFSFLMAIDAFKRVNGVTFPTWTDVLEIVRKLGYRKTCPSELNLGGRIEDWTERADAPSGVHKDPPLTRLAG